MRNYLMEFMKPEIDALVRERDFETAKETAKVVAKNIEKRMFKQGIFYEICMVSMEEDIVSDEEL